MRELLSSGTEGTSTEQHTELAYVLVTPVKNEEDNLPGLIQSIADQTIRPVAWFIVDDASDDRSPQIINDAASDYPWIQVVRLRENHAYHTGTYYASACISGFNQAFVYARENNVDFGYIALADADMIFPPEYFARCIAFLCDNRQFGIVSGRLLVKDEQGALYDEFGVQLGDGWPAGGGRVWTRESFMDTDGYLVAKAPDSVSNIKAIVRGWRIKRLLDTAYYQTRHTGGKAGLWSGYFKRGERGYYRGMTPLSIFNAVVEMMFISRPRGRLTRSLALVAGYCTAFLRRDERLDDEEVRRYCGSYRRVVKNYWLFLRGSRKR